jgi:RNA polymerase sigma factor (sigma-70 family)
VSPSTLRRYRAERLLRQEFEGLRGSVLESVRRRLRARGVRLDTSDLEACYAIAWQGLYAAIDAGEEVANPAGWLTVVTFRRAIDELRSAPAGRAPAERVASEPDLAAELDDRARLRQLFEALRGRLNPRECEAAALCYLQGLTRAQAAARMGISEARMGKLMEGRGPGRPGVAGKVGELLEAIRGGRWCEQQASQMRALAFGILEPGGERYRMARLHQRECPACRAYILSLRGLAAVLPPLPLPWSLGAVGTGSAAGGGWLLGGSMGAKLAVSCVLALSVGCVALTVAPHQVRHRHSHRETLARNAYVATTRPQLVGGSARLGEALARKSIVGGVPRSAPTFVSRSASARHAQREFGPEQPATAARVTAPAPVTARAASRHLSGETTGEEAAPLAPTAPPTHAEREFGPE